MGQISIPMSNKVGYSMYWSSMWDNKINYNRSLKEDIFFKKFITYIFNDNVSINFFYNNNIKFIKKNNYKFYIKNIKNKKSFKSKNKNKNDLYLSKTWVLKYQKWFVVYNFIYLSRFNQLNKKKILNSTKKSYNSNLNNLYSFYLETKFNYFLSYKNSKNQNKNTYF